MNMPKDPQPTDAPKWKYDGSYYGPPSPFRDSEPSVRTKAAKPAEPMRYYDHVAVLLLRWDDEIDDLGTKEEVEELEKTFSEKFHYQTTIAEINGQSHAQDQLQKICSDFIRDHDGTNRLLIVYYVGKSSLNEYRKTLELVAGEGPSFILADWNPIDDLFLRPFINADVLTILDTCYASNLVQFAEKGDGKEPNASLQSDSNAYDPTPTSSRLGPVNRVETLTASSIDQMTAVPGQDSFTRALIDALGILHAQHPSSAFSTLLLTEKINATNSRLNTPSRLWSRSRGQNDRHIQLGPLLGQLDTGEIPTISDTSHTSMLHQRRDTTSAVPIETKMRAEDLMQYLDAFGDRTSSVGNTPYPGSPASNTAGIDWTSSVAGTGVGGHQAAVDHHQLQLERLEVKLQETLERQARNKDESDSASESALSDIGSLWSVDYSNSSLSSLDELQEISQSAAKKLTEILWQNPDVHDLYIAAADRLSKEVFCKSHDALLKVFFGELRLETSTNTQLRSVRLLRHSTQREQVTKTLYTLAGPKEDLETLRARQNFLDQKDHRDELLERFLLSQTEPQKTESAPEPVQDIDENSDSGESEAEETMSLEELESIIAFVTTGLAFAMLRANLYGLAYPEKAVQEVLRTKSRPEVLESLLTRQFNRVAVGDYAWIRELDATGYTTKEIAQLLSEESTDSPWILFEPREVSEEQPDPEFHLPGCTHLTHQMLHKKALAHTKSYTKEQDPKSYSESEEVCEGLQELCGLAGILPIDHNRESWNGIVNFTDDNTIAEVTYGTITIEPVQILSRCLQTLERLLAAFRLAQTESMCCDRFTVITHEALPRFGSVHETRSVVMSSLRFSTVQRLVQASSVFREIWYGSQRFEDKRIPGENSSQDTSQPGSNDCTEMKDIALEILVPLGLHTIPSDSRWRFDETLHVVALAAQFASLAFLYYIQAHASPLQPFFLDTAQQEIVLLGACQSPTAPFWITARSTRLTCLGDMLGRPVAVFSITAREEQFSFNSEQERYDLRALPGDLLDTWVDGCLFAPPDRNDRYFAIQLCGGIIAPLAAVESEESLGSREVILHWSRTNVKYEFYSTFDLADQVRIGALVNVNKACIRDEDRSWRLSTPAFEELGVQDDFWDHIQSQIGAQVGQYVNVQFLRVKQKIPGVTLKQEILSNIQNEGHAHLVQDYLNHQCGVQVSFCTGVARRIPLRVLMADALPLVAQATPEGKIMWDVLARQHGAIQALRSEDVITWLNDLSKPHRDFLFQNMRTILLHLKATGISKDRNDMTVAWVYRTPYQCLKIDCEEKHHSWLRVLADSGDCATFAYIVLDCLETSSVKCRGSSLWNNRAPMIETAVMRYNSRPAQPLGPLKDDQSYFFKKMDALLLVSVDKEQSTHNIRLYVTPSSMPWKFQARVSHLERVRLKASRIRERRHNDDLGAEAVAILAKS